MSSPTTRGELVEIVSQNYNRLKQKYNGNTKKAFNVAIREALNLYGFKFNINTEEQMILAFNELHKPKEQGEQVVPNMQPIIPANGLQIPLFS